MSNRNIILAAAGGVPSGPVDPNFNQTVLLLHGDGTNGAQNNTFLDSSTNNFTITRNGNTTQGTFSPFSNADGEWSNYFNGDANSFVRFTDAGNVLDLDGDFTLEFWVYQPAYATLNGTGNVFVSVDTLDRFQILQNSTNIRMWINGSVVLTSATKADLNTWGHYCITRSGTDLTMYLNGTSVATGTSSYSMACSRLTIGGQDRGGTTVYNGCNSYISNFRIVKGSAIAPPSGGPTSPLTAVSGTSLLTCQSNRFVDNSGNALAEIPGTTPSIQPFSPFAPSAAYSPSVNGGSGYFDGTGDYLTAPDSADFSLGSNNFCLEAWVYAITAPTYAQICGQFGPGGVLNSDRAYWIRFDAATGKIQGIVTNNGSSETVVTDASVLTLNSWHHVAFVRNGNNLYLYVDGTQVGTTSFASSVHDSSHTFSIGGANNGVEIWNGYISNVRLVNGSPVYTGAFTPPTAPLTAVSGTELLCNFTNAGILDNTGKNNLETVGNAQVDTSVVKYGTGSMKFDGTGDYLVSSGSNQNLNVGSGDFTIEGWFYFNTTPSTMGLFQMSATAGGFVGNQSANLAVATASSTTWQIYAKNTFTTSSATSVPVTTWTHFALVRNGTDTDLYINGTAVISLTSDSTVYNTPYIGIGGIFDNSSYLLNGYIDDLRITKGVARYTANFTPPTAPFPDQ